MKTPTKKQEAKPEKKPEKKFEKGWEIIKNLASIILIIGAIFGFSQFVHGTYVIALEEWNNWHESRKALLPITTIGPLFRGIDYENTTNYLKSQKRIGTCKDDVITSLLDVYESKLPDGIGGRFFLYQGQGIIELQKGFAGQSAVNVVSHEVSHWVDRIVTAKQINDTETRAYLQGYYTECVMKLVESK